MNKNNIYLELVNEKHHKFYELIQADKEIKINFGRIGRAGKVKIIHFKSIPEASIFFEKQIDRKIRRGYQKATKGITPPRVKGFHSGQLRFAFDFIKT